MFSFIVHIENENIFILQVTRGFRNFSNALAAAEAKRMDASTHFIYEYERIKAELMNATLIEAKLTESCNKSKVHNKV